MANMVLELSTKKSDVEAPREEFFSIDGKMFTIPVDVPAVEGVRYLNDVRRGGMEFAVARLMERMVGQEGMEALARATDMKPADLKTLISYVQKKVNDMVGDALGN